jgi:nucleobase:cation symporter-1, NCS1 family
VLVALLVGIVVVNVFGNLVAKPSQMTDVPCPAIIPGLIAVAW